ncbi:MAG: hypothetical protein BM556_12445 [Bacteriovorax sp. MedPE-SWde]|nr:MAG: hypothetical protein BM556_12445 [Bacteriovorax sp. MedPE-SWde]
MKKIILLLLSVFIYSPLTLAESLDEFSELSLDEKYEHFASLGVPRRPLTHTFKFYEKNDKIIYNKRYVSIADYSQHSKNKRWYIMDMETGLLQREYVSHGSGRNRLGFPVADIGHRGKPKRCRHSRFSRRLRLVPHRIWGMTRPGFIRVDGTYHSKKFAYGEYKKTKAPNALLLTGLERSSSDVRRNAVVIHEAWYVKDKRVKQGRSLGCPSVPQGRMPHIIDKIKGGSLFYSYVPQCM